MRHFPLIGSVAAFLLAASVPVVAQTVEATASAPSFQRVLDKCTEVAENPDIADVRFGICIEETRDYIRSLSSLPSDLVQATLVELVVALGELAPLSNENMCTEFEDELAQAILVAGNASTNPDQQESILLIAETIVDTCNDPAFATASIGSLE